MRRWTLLTSVGLGLGLTVGLLWLLGAGLLVVKAQGPDGIGIYHVAPGGSCGGASPCYSTVQAAVDAADDPNDVIKVAAGTFTDVHSYGGLTQMAYVDKTVTIRGGYTLTNWARPYPITQSTILDAREQGRVLYVSGDIAPTIEGLHFTGGSAYGYPGPGSKYRGGGVCIVTATATIRNCQVLSNVAWSGGGVLLWFSDAILDGNTIFSNTADGYGGGVCLLHSDATLTGNTISLNTVSGDASNNGGGGLYLYESPATLAGNTIFSNTSSYQGGGLYLDGSDATLIANNISFNVAHDDGGGVALWYSEATLTGNTIFSNTATGRGGGLHRVNYPEFYIDLELDGNTILSNAADRGGGLYLEWGIGTLSGNAILSNTANRGGGMYLAVTAPTLTNNVVAGNTANDTGSGIYIYDSWPHLLHTTLARNHGGDGSGVYVDGYPRSIFLTNTILVSQTVGIYVTTGTVTLAGTLWGEGEWANGHDWDGDGAILTGSVNVWGNPAFVDPGAGDYHIGSGSAAIDVGIAAGVSIDIDREPRLGAPDLGADEYWAPGSLKRAFLPVVLR